MDKVFAKNAATDLFGDIDVTEEEIVAIQYNFDLSKLKLRDSARYKLESNPVLFWKDLDRITKDYLKRVVKHKSQEEFEEFLNDINNYMIKMNYFTYDCVDIKDNLFLKFDSGKERKQEIHKLKTMRGVKKAQKRADRQDAKNKDLKVQAMKKRERTFTSAPSGVIKGKNTQTKLEQSQWKAKQAEKRLNRISQRRKSLLSDKIDIHTHREIMRAKKLSKRAARKEKRKSKINATTEAYSYSKHQDELDRMFIYLDTYIGRDVLGGGIIGSITGHLIAEVFDYLMLFYQMVRCRNIWDVMSHIYTSSKFINMRDTLNSNNIQVMIVDVYNYFQSLKTTQSLTDTLPSWEGFLNSIHESKVFQSIRNIILKLFSLSVFKCDLTDKFITLLGRTKRGSILSFVSNIIGDIATIYKFFEVWWNKGSFSEAIFQSDPVESLLQESRKLFSYNELLYTGLPTAGRMCQYEYVAESEKLVNSMNMLMKNMNNFSQGYKSLLDQSIKLSTRHNELKSIVLSRQRPFPMGVIITGDPGIGKSSILTYACALWSKVKGRKFEKDQVFTRVVGSQYWEGYLPVSHRIIKYPEVANRNRKITAKIGDEVLTELNSLMDTEPLPVNVAFNDKGKLYACPEFVIMDTNTENLNASDSVNNPSAILRRFVTVRARVKQEFKQPEPLCGLDPKKALDADGKMDMWHFEIVKKHPINNTEYHSEVYHADNEDELERVLTMLYTTHIELQSSYMTRQQEMIDRMAPKDINLETTTESSSYSNIGHYIYEAVDYTRKTTTALYKYSSYSILLALFWYAGDHTKFDKWFSFSLTNSLIVLFMFLWLGSIHSIYYALLPFCMVFANLDGDFYKSLINFSNHKDRRVYKHKWNRESENIKHLLFGHPYVPFLVVSGSLYAAFTFLRFVLDTADIFTTTESSTNFVNESRYDKEINEFEESVGCRPSLTRVKNKIHNHWNTMTQDNLPCFTGDLESMPMCFSNNIRRFRIPQVNSESYLLGVKGSYAVLNTHALKGLKEFTIQICTSDSWDSDRAPYENYITMSRRKDLANDITVLNLGGVRYRDILKHITTGPIKNTLSSKAIFKGTSLRTKYIEQEVVLKDSVNPVNVSGLYMYDYAAHKGGLCGIPIFIESGKGGQIAGIHVAGDDFNDSAYATALSRHAIEQAINEISSASSLHTISTQSNLDLSLLRPISKSSVFYVPLGGMEYHGKLPGNILIKGKSKLIRTPFHNEILDLFERNMNHIPKIQYGPPLMEPTVRNGKYVNPYNVALEKYSTSKPGLHHDLLSMIIAEYTAFIMSNLKQYKLSPLTLEESINGSLDDAFLRRMNASTSSGFGLNGPKSKHIVDVSYEQDGSLRELSEANREQILQLIDIMKDGNSLNFINDLKLKDEPREKSKIDIGKTRPFCVSQLHAVILARMFLSPMYMLMVENNFAFCTSVGINMHSNAAYVVDTLTNFSPYIMEGDYSNYDQTMPFDIGWAANSVVRNILETFGYSKEALKCVDVLLSENLFSYVNMNKDIFMVPGLQPSGKYATAEDNSLRGVILMMYAWYSGGKSPGTFFQNVRPITYGDDVLAAVKPESKDYFNNNFYQEACKKHFNMKYTSASKSADMKDFLSIEQVSFLKRSFRKRSEYWIAPLDKDSIIKSLIWYIPSKFVSEEKQMTDTMNSSLWELFFHLNESEFNTVRREFIHLLSKHYELKEEETQNVLVKYEYITQSLYPHENTIDSYPELLDIEIPSTIKLA